MTATTDRADRLCANCTDLRCSKGMTTGEKVGGCPCYKPHPSLTDWREKWATKGQPDEAVIGCHPQEAWLGRWRKRIGWEKPKPHVHVWERREIGETTAEDSVGRHEWYVCAGCGKVEARPRPRLTFEVLLGQMARTRPPWMGGPMAPVSGNPRGNDFLRAIWREEEKRTQGRRDRDAEFRRWYARRQARQRAHVPGHVHCGKCGGVATEAPDKDVLRCTVCGAEDWPSVRGWK